MSVHVGERNNIIGKNILLFSLIIHCFQININGMISFGKKYYRAEPKKLKDLKKDVLAVFWANTDITLYTEITYQVVDRSTPEFIEVLSCGLAYDHSYSMYAYIYVSPYFINLLCLWTLIGIRLSSA